MKLQKTYKITVCHSPLFSHKITKTDFVGTLDQLTNIFSYTLEVGKSYEYEKGRKKINLHPTTIKSLCTNLVNSSNNSAANGYSGYDYTYELV